MGRCAWLAASLGAEQVMDKREARGPEAGEKTVGSQRGEGSGGLEIVRRVISGDPCGAEGQAVAPGLRMTDRHLLELGGHCPCGITT